MHSIRTRLTVLFVTLSSVVAVLIAGYFIYAFVAKNQADVASYRQLLNDQFDREIRQQTEGLVSSLDAIYAAQQAGTLTEQEARALAIATIKSDRYDDGKGYFFADDKQTGVCVAHATLGSKVEGKRRGRLLQLLLPQAGRERRHAEARLLHGVQALRLDHLHGDMDRLHRRGGAGL